MLTIRTLLPLCLSASSFSAMNLSYVYELLIVRKLKGQLGLPNIPHLALRFAVAYAVGGLSCFGLWVILYAAFGNMVA